jgi:alginate O-acetyltransferase complex protein AlgI
MTFDLGMILLSCAAALLYAALLPARWRGWALLVASVIAVYWLQPALPIRFLDFILPTATLVLAAAVWRFAGYANDTDRAATWREDRITLALIAALVIGMSFMRFIQPEYRLTASRPPDPLVVMLALAGVGGIVTACWLLLRGRDRWRVLTGVILLVVGVFIVLKAEPLAVEISRTLRAQAEQDTTLAAKIDLEWLGFSYIAFRLIHTLRDRQSGKLPALSLREYMTYIVFFPSFIAGPIDRAERFIKDVRALPEMAGLDAGRITEGVGRIVVGLGKKFIIADTLALGLALNAANAQQAETALGLWVLLYGYALRLFFDFSGYTDIAIGIGILFGVKLPENFDRPYLKSDIATFWQSWHMTLSNWARFYVFSPLSRLLLTRQPKPSPVVVVLSSQLTTMVVIGLWHGITWNFLVWGIWHGVGLFVHKQWSDRTRKWYLSLRDKPGRKRAWTLFAWFITVHFVVLGWVWFALPDFDLSLRVFGGLFGLGGDW